MKIELPENGDMNVIIELVAEVLGSARAPSFVEAYARRHQLLVAKMAKEIVGVLAYRNDWFECTMVTLVCVHKDFRRRGIAQALYKRAERLSLSPRLFSSTEETNAISIQMHRAFGFSPSGHIDNLPQGYRELLFYKRLRRQWLVEGKDLN